MIENLEIKMLKVDNKLLSIDDEIN